MILITGSLAYDHIMDFPGRFGDHILPDKIHILNVSFLVHDLHKSFGGTAGNIAYTLSLLGVKCTILGMVGGDFTSYKEFLEKNEVDTRYIKTANNLYTSVAFGITDRGDNQIWGFYAGADLLSEHLSIFDVKGRIDLGIVAPNQPKAMTRFAGEYQQKKIPYLFDPGMQLPHLSAQELRMAFKGARIIVGNDYEIQVMQKKTGIADLTVLSKDNKIIITTLGEHGSDISGDSQSIHILPARVKRADDPAGAGDAYRAGFVAGFMRGLSLSVCGQMGAVAAAYTVEKYGTTTHFFTPEEFARRYKENFGEEIKL